MLKRKKLFIVAVVIVLMLAMTVTAYATTYYCHLYPNQTGSVKTAGLYTRYVHRDAVNWGNSGDNMIARLQFYNGGWSKVPGDYKLAPGVVLHEPQWDCGSNYSFRTKIYSEHGGLGGVEGTGDVAN